MAVILAIDLGEYKSVACRYEDGEFAFRTFVTSREALDRLLAEWPADVVAVEACAVAGWVYDHCVAKNVRCLVANTAAEAWKFKHAKRKTDKDDALRLAQLTALGQLPMVTTPEASVRQKRSLIGYRQTLVGRRVAVRKRLRARTRWRMETARPEDVLMKGWCGVSRWVGLDRRRGLAERGGLLRRAAESFRAICFPNDDQPSEGRPRRNC